LSRSRFAYIDRRLGALKTDPIYAAGFLMWCYNTRPGRFLTRLLLSRRFVSALYGWYYNRPWTRRRILPFARSMAVNLDELADPIESFSSFAAFIRREIDLTKRRIDADPQNCVAPCDGRLLAYSRVEAGTSFEIKGGLFDMKRLLGDAALAERFDGGAIVVLRLYLSDYHHFHFPDSGIPGEPRFLPGRYFAVSPYATEWTVSFYGENHRVVTLFESDYFGSIGMVEVGAFVVGSVRQCFVPGRRVAKGAHKGFFDLGGSIVVLLFEPGAVSIDKDLCDNTLAGLETYVFMGESIGRAIPQNPKQGVI
jgi:phosphatidylserine decarboxylase